MTKHQSVDSVEASIPITDDCEGVARYNGCYQYEPPTLLFIDAGWDFLSGSPQCCYANGWNTPLLGGGGGFHNSGTYWLYPPGSSTCDYTNQYIEFRPPDGDSRVFKVKTMLN
jgi:hypothetical protein